MSRRCHHGSPRHLRQAARERRPGQVVAERPLAAQAEWPLGAPAADPANQSDEGAEAAEQRAGQEAPDGEVRAADAIPTVGSTDTLPMTSADGGPMPDAALPSDPARLPAATPQSRQAPGVAPVLAVASPAPARARLPGPRLARLPVGADAPPVRPPHRPREAGPEQDAGPGDPGLERGATAPQLRRFIKSRAYVPMHELRRRFAINGGDDDVIPIDVDRHRVYVGLPPREGSLLGELLRAGDIGYELSLDPIAPIVVGVYPMRPVPRS